MSPSWPNDLRGMAEVATRADQTLGKCKHLDVVLQAWKVHDGELAGALDLYWTRMKRVLEVTGGINPRFTYPCKDFFC